MRLTPTVSNKAVIDCNGNVTAVIENIEFIDRTDSEYEREQYKWIIKVEGTKKPIYMTIWTGTKISTQKYYIGAELDHSSLSKIVMNLGLISEKDLTDVEDLGEDVDINLNELIGKSVRFKLIKRSKRAKFERPDLDTIELINN